MEKEETMTFDELGWTVYAAFALLLIYIYWHARSMSLDVLRKRVNEEHEKTHKVLKKHPQGGSWSEYKRWHKE